MKNPSCKYCGKQMFLNIDEIDPMGYPWIIGTAWYRCSCGSQTPDAKFGSGYGTKEAALKRLKKRFGE